MWFIGVEVEQETGAPPPKKNPGSAPGKGVLGSERNARGSVVSRPNPLPLPFRTPAKQTIWLFVHHFVFAVLFIPSFHVF